MNHDEILFSVTITACVISILSLFATLFSTYSAKVSSTTAREALQTSRLSEILNLAEGIVADEKLIGSLSEDLRLSMNSNAIATGTFGSARHKLFENKILEDAEFVATHANLGRDTLKDSSILLSEEGRYLLKLSADLRISRSELQVKKIVIERQLFDIRQQLQYK